MLANDDADDRRSFKYRKKLRRLYVLTTAISALCSLIYWTSHLQATTAETAAIRSTNIAILLVWTIHFMSVLRIFLWWRLDMRMLHQPTDKSCQLIFLLTGVLPSFFIICGIKTVTAGTYYLAVLLFMKVNGEQFRCGALSDLGAFEESLIMWLLSEHLWYALIFESNLCIQVGRHATGHEPNFGSLPVSCAFVGFSDFYAFPAGIILLSNVFGVNEVGVISRVIAVFLVASAASICCLNFA